MHVFSLRCHRAAAACGLGSLLLVVGAARPAAAQVYADFETTNGNFTVELYYQDVPRTVANFVSLAEGTRPWLHPVWQPPHSLTRQVNKPFFDGVIFHRVIKGFMNQGGCPLGAGSSGPGYKFPDEFTKSPNGELLHRHGPGMISMANSGAHTNGSQFFIVASNSSTSYLDDSYTVFGRIASGPYGTEAAGMTVIDAINNVATNSNDRPLVNVVMKKVRIRRVGAAAEAFDELAWQLPVIAQASREVFKLSHTPPETEGGEPNVLLQVTPPRGCYYVAEESNDLKAWSILAATSLSTTGSIQSYRIPRLTGETSYYIRPQTEVSYEMLIASSIPPLSTEAVLELKTTSPALTLRVARSNAAGTWHITSPASSGALTNCDYEQGSGEAGLFSPVFSLVFQDPLPWTGGAALKSLSLSLTFNAGASPSTGYFSATGTTTTDATVAPKGIFRIITP